jgi:hypothetical protein
MGILFISVTVAIVIIAFIAISAKRRKKTIDKTTVGGHDVVTDEPGNKKGIYD